jgi:5'-nucleotidase
MRILLTNDDGIDGEGLLVLECFLSAFHEVWVIAPDTNRSAVSHGITMTTPLRFQKTAERKYACSGVPVDCVVSGLRGVLPDLPDVVISGINCGANIGTDLLFSGTAAAARQASLYGIPGIALSIESLNGTWHYEALAAFARDNLDQLMKLCDRDIFVNVNAVSAQSYSGCRLTGLSRRGYNDHIELFTGPDGHSYSVFKGGTICTESSEDDDFATVKKGFVSVTRVHSQPFAAGCDEFQELEFIV